MIHYFYRLKRLLRMKQLFFWSIIFPLLLGTVFKVAFSDATNKDWGFATIPVAVTTEEGGTQDAAFISFLKEMKNGDVAFFAVEECDRETAEAMLSGGDVSAVIVTGEETKVILRENGLNSTVVKTVVDGYLQSKDMFVEAAMTGKLTEVIGAFSEEIETLGVKEFEGTSKDPFVQYFQALIAMASLYGAMYGLMNTNELNIKFANVSARRLAAPMRAIPTVLCDVAAAFTIQYIQFLINIAYFILILKVDFGSINGWLFLGGVLYSLLGVLNGYFIGTVVQKSDGLQNAIMMGCTMFSCFLAGLMVGNIRISIELTAPIVNRVNQATLIADSMQALCIMGDMEKYARCLLGILIWCVCLVVGSILVLMVRQRKTGRSVKQA